jgi:hypothetical protein
VTGKIFPGLSLGIIESVTSEEYATSPMVSVSEKNLLNPILIILWPGLKKI